MVNIDQKWTETRSHDKSIFNNWDSVLHPHPTTIRAVDQSCVSYKIPAQAGQSYKSSDLCYPVKNVLRALAKDIQYLMKAGGGHRFCISGAYKQRNKGIEFGEMNILDEK